MRSDSGRAVRTPRRSKLGFALGVLAALASGCGAGADRTVTLRHAQQLAATASVSSDLVLVANDAVVTKLNSLVASAGARSSTRLILSRMDTYASTVQARIAQYGAPRELQAIPLHESAYRPDANNGSAAGLWQFLAGTARDYGLTVSGGTDDRLDPDKSTDAAIRYFNDLYGQLGDWNLAVKAYNLGPAAVRAAIDAQGTRDAWALERAETGNGNYLAAFTAWAIMMRNRDLAND